MHSLCMCGKHRAIAMLGSRETSMAPNDHHIEQASPPLNGMSIAMLVLAGAVAGGATGHGTAEHRGR
eukprot:5860640-Alexandrium_andersonii.AAC.1